MTHAVSLHAERHTSGRPAADVTHHARRAGRVALRVLSITAGAVLIVGGLVIAVIPFVHTAGIPLVAVGLILVLRNSRRARRNFIHLQRRHPNYVFPVRRLIRRDPEIVPVIWQQVLRFERLVLPQRWRRIGHWRRRYLRAAR
jgi:hypothetical protein